MPYIVSAETSADELTATSLVASIPFGHRSGDIVVAIASQDGGSGTISFPAGWTEFGPTQIAEQAQRTVCAWHDCTSGSEPDLTVSSTLSEQWSLSLIVIRGAHVSAPIHQVARASLSGATPQAPAVTTTLTNCLVLYALSYDGAPILAPLDPSAQTYVCKTRESGANTHLVGFKNKLSEGAVDRPNFLSSNAGEGGSFLTIAIRDDGNGYMGPECPEPYKVVGLYGAFYTHENWTFNPLSSITTSTIDGLPVDTTAASIIGFLAVASHTANTLNPPLLATHTVTLAADAWVGFSHAISPALDMSGGCQFSVRFGINNGGEPFSTKGFIVLFKDSAGAWVAHQLSEKAGLKIGVTGVTFHACVDLEYTPYASGGGTIDWSDIVAVGYGSHRAAALATTRSLYICDALFIRKSLGVGGSQAAPLNFTFFHNAVSGFHDNPLTNLQGSAQLLSRARLHFGDGATATYTDTSANAVEYPLAPTPKFPLRLWKVDDSSVEIRIKASASDVVRMTAAVAATDTLQNFIIDPASSASASYNFGGLVLVGFNVTNNVSGVVINGTVFSKTRGVTLNGGGLDGCTVDSSLTAIAVTTSNPGNIIDCSFVSDGSGHAIEITTPGTYTFSGNTFAGYGSAGTADAAIYNNSGGAVTLNITNGGDTPTVTNGASASTTINNNVSLTLEDVVSGSSIRIEKTSDGSLIEFRVADATTEVFSVAGGIGYTVKVRKSSAPPKYEPWETNTGTLSANQTIFVSQVADQIAA